jgi:hypothetical protein
VKIYAYRILVGKLERMRPNGGCRYRCEANIRTHLKKIGENMDLIYLTEDKEQRETPCEYGNEPSGSIKYREYLD